MIKFGREQVKWICALALTGLASGCSNHESPKSLARRLGEADRVTIASQFADRAPFTMQLRVEEANRLVQAVATSRKESPLVTTTPQLDVRFFKGTNVLSELEVGAKVFWVNFAPDPKQPKLRRVGPFSDDSGTLEMLGEKFWQEAATAAETNQIGR